MPLLHPQQPGERERRRDGGAEGASSFRQFGHEFASAGFPAQAGFRHVPKACTGR